MTDLKAAMDVVAKTQGITLGDKGKRYTTVAQRTEALRATTGDTYGIETEILFYPSTTSDTIVFKAIVRDKEGRIIGVGHAEETRGSNWINETSALEACETSAIGRALASMGLHGGEYASTNEIAIAEGKRAASVGSGAPLAAVNTGPTTLVHQAQPSINSAGTLPTAMAAATAQATPSLQTTTNGGWQTAVEAFRTFARECQSAKALGEFWAANRHVIDDMKVKAPVFFAEAKDIFAQRDAALSRSQGTGL